MFFVLHVVYEHLGTGYLKMCKVVFSEDVVSSSSVFSNSAQFWPGAYLVYFTNACVLICGKRGAVCGKLLTFLRNSHYEHVKYNI